MKQILYFLIGFCISVVWGCQYAYADCVDLSAFYAAHSNAADITSFSSYAAASAAADSLAASVEFPFVSGVTIGSETYYSQRVQFCDVQLQVAASPSVWEHHFYIYYPTSVCAPDSDDDGIPDGLDAYPDTDSAYQFRIMVNYFDSEGNCVAQLIVTSSGDYVLLGDLTAGEIKAGVVDGTYNSDFVNSPIWIESSDLENDDASDIYASGDSTTSVTSTTASGLSDSATTANAGNLSTADSVTSGSTYDSSSDTDSSALGKIVDNTAATTSNQQTLANYAKKQAELQASNNTLQSGQLDQLAKINDTLENQAETTAKRREDQETEASEAATEFTNKSVDTYYNSNNYNGTLTSETDYQEAQELVELSWFTDFFTNNPLKTALNASGFNLSSSACELTLIIDGMGTHELSLCEFSEGFEAAGNFLLSFTTLLSLIIIAWR